MNFKNEGFFVFCTMGSPCASIYFLSLFLFALFKSVYMFKLLVFIHFQSQDLTLAPLSIKPFFSFTSNYRSHTSEAFGMILS